MSQAPFNPWWQRIAAFLAIASIWPVILGWPAPVWKYLMWTMLGVMAIFFAINVVRLRRMGRRSASDDQT